jgi:HAD superfamily hydrolase (TIGR01509 family)
MHPSRRPAAVVFDLDGTLVETVGARIEAWEEALQEAGIPVTRSQLAPMIGMDGVRLAREIATVADRRLPDQEAEALDERAGALFDVRNVDPAPLPGARDCLARLDAAGITWAIATSSRAEQVSASVAALRLDHQPRVIDGSSVSHAKPAPDLLLLAAQRLAVEPAETWYVGDSTWDMRAAVAAGMTPIGVVAGAALDADALREAGASVVLETLDTLQLPE